MNCPRCGESNPAGAADCARCGRSFFDEDEGGQTRMSAPGAVAAARRPGSGEPDSDSGSSSGYDEDSLSATIAGVSSPGGAAGSMAAYDALKPGALLGGRYEIIDTLGIGGMGIVYHARDTKLEREVALKVIRPGMAEHTDVMERFRREILLASKITHKHILRIHDLGESDGLSYISMAYVKGETLKDAIRREGSLPLEKAIPLAHQMGEALQAAHEAGVVHRDLKPQNVLLDEAGNSYIADFGLSRSLDSGETMTQTGMILGTIDYMAPEQARGETPDHRGDIYSFGLILYEMLTGTLPFKTENALSSMMMRVHKDVPKVRDMTHGVPSWMSGIVARCCARDPENRYQKATEILRDIDARRASFAWSRRLRKPSFWLKTAAILVAAALAVVGGTQAVRMFLARQESGPVALKASLALLPFQNSTGDPRLDWTSAGLPDLLRTDLQQSRSLRIVGSDRVHGILAGLHLGDAGGYRDDDARRLAGLLSVDNLVTGNLMRAGEQFRIEATLRTTLASGLSAGDPIRVEGAGEDAIFQMVDELSRRIREQLGVTGGWGESDAGVTDLATSSVAALGLYTEATGMVRAGNNLAAAQRLEEALAEDPQFTAAGALLAETYDRLGYADKALEAADRAAQGLSSASPYEAARVRAVRARLRNDMDEAIAAYRELTELSPNSAEAIFNLAIALEDGGKLEEARTSLLRAIELDPKHADAQYALGRVEIKLGNVDEGIAALNTALLLQTQAANDEGRASVLNGLGNAFQATGRDDEAMKRYEEALTIRRQIGDRRGEAIVLRNIAVVQMGQSQYDAAIESGEAAAAIFRDIGDRAALGRWYSTLGDIYQELGRPEDALAAYQDSLRTVRDLGDESALSWALSNIGYINMALGHYLEAYFFMKEALEQSRDSGDRFDVLQSLIGIGTVESFQGRHEDSLKYLLEALEIARSAGMKEAIGVVQANLALVREDQGDYGAALASVEEAESLARESDDPGLLGDSLYYKGSILLRMGDTAASRAALEEARSVVKDLGSPEQFCKLDLAWSMLLEESGDRDGARESARRAAEAAADAGQARLLIWTRIQLAGIDADTAALGKAAEEAEKMGLAPFVGPARLALARLYDARGNRDAAIRETDLAAAAADAIGQRDVLFQAHHLAGRLRAQAGRTEEALGHLTSALTLLEEMAEALPQERRAAFVSRPESAAFVRDAGARYREAGRTSEAERLAALSPR